jgi:hypothetical protein
MNVVIDCEHRPTDALSPARPDPSVEEEVSEHQHEQRNAEQPAEKILAHDVSPVGSS